MSLKANPCEQFVPIENRPNHDSKISHGYMHLLVCSFVCFVFFRYFYDFYRTTNVQIVEININKVNYLKDIINNRNAESSAMAKVRYRLRPTQ